MRSTPEEYRRLDERLAAIGTEGLLQRTGGALAPRIEATSPVTGSWPQIIPFGSEIVPVSDLPIDAFPIPAQEMIQAVTECTGQDMNIAAAVFIGALSASARGRYTVKLPTHREHVTLYTLAASPSGTMKDDMLRFMITPLEDWLSEKQEHEKAGITEALTRVAYLKKRHDALIQDASSTRPAKKSAKEEIDREVILKQASALSLELKDEEKKTIGTRILIDNATTETLPRFLSRHGSGAVLSSEARGFWGIVLGRYSDGRIDPDLLNKAYDAQAYHFDRTKESIFLKCPSLSIAQIVQNDLVLKIIADDGLRDCGLVHRFIFVVGSPMPPLPYDPERRPTARVITEYDGVIRDMLNRADQCEPGTMMELSLGALEAWIPFHDEVKKATVPPEYLSGMIAPWSRKHPGRAIRLAALFHLLAGGSPRDPIGKADMLRAIAIMTELVPHALRAYEGAKDFSPAIERAQKIVDWLKRGKRDRFTIFEAGVNINPQIRTSGDRQAAVQVLIDRGMIRPAKGQTPAQKLLEVNPAIFGES